MERLWSLYNRRRSPACTSQCNPHPHQHTNPNTDPYPNTHSNAHNITNGYQDANPFSYSHLRSFSNIVATIGYQHRDCVTLPNSNLYAWTNSDTSHSIPHHNALANRHSDYPDANHHPSSEPYPHTMTSPT